MPPRPSTVRRVRPGAWRDSGWKGAGIISILANPEGSRIGTHLIQWSRSPRLPEIEDVGLFSVLENSLERTCHSRTRLLIRRDGRRNPVRDRWP